MHTSDLSAEPRSGRSIYLNRQVLPWAFWDWASAAFNAVVTTFVFSPYLSNAELFGDRANTYLGWTLSAAGILVALVAPAAGEWADRTGKKNSLLTVTTLATVVCMALLFFVKPGVSYLGIGLVLLGVGNVVAEMGDVVYNSMVTDVSTPATVGRVSGFGWGMGYVGGIILLLVLYVGLIRPDTGWLAIESLNIRMCMLACAAWTLIFSLPLMLTSVNSARSGVDTRGIPGAYREVFRSIARLWRRDRSVVWFLISSAIYRDGLAGVFSFGGVIAAAAFGFSAGDVLIFGIVANLVAGLATILFGWLDDRVGSRALIIFSLVCTTLAGLAVFFFHDSGRGIFWVFGLLLSVFVGPVQSSSRAYLARLAPAGMSGQIFGLYATTGRAVSFLAPALYSVAITVGAALAGVSRAQAAYFGIIGIVVVLVAGLITFLFVKAPAPRR